MNITPRFELSKSMVMEKYQSLEKFTDIISYSSKTNPDVTKILEKHSDSMFSIHTENELKHIKDNSKVWFLAQAWSEEVIKRLLHKGISNFVVDNKADLNVLKDFLKESNHKISLLLRVKLRENTLRTEKYFVFGMDVDLIEKEIKILRKNKQIMKLGIHFHRKTQNMAEWNLVEEIGGMFRKETFENIDYFNIGGGLPSVYANTNPKVISGIFNRIAEFKLWLNKQKIEMIIEPGRYIAAPAVKLITKVLMVEKNNVIVDASVYNSDMDALIVPVKLLVFGEKEAGNAYTIKGSTPCSLDLFRYKVYLDEVKKGDEIVFINAGAYNFTSDFCDLDKIPTLEVD